MPVLSVARLNETVVVVEKAVNEKLISEFDRAIPSGLVSFGATKTELRSASVSSNSTLDFAHIRTTSGAHLQKRG